MYNKTRRKMNRTGNSPCDICENVRTLEQHHIRGRKIPKYNKPNNLSNICPNCHTDVHNGKIIIDGWHMTTQGRQLIFEYACST